MYHGIKVYIRNAVWDAGQAKFSLFGQHPDEATVGFGEAQNPAVAAEEAAADSAAQQPGSIGH